MKKILFKPILAGICSATLLMSALSVGAITINDANVVGTIVSGEPASIANEVDWVNKLLSLGENVVNTPYGGHLLSRSSTPYSGSVSEVGAFRLNADISKDVPNPAFTLTVSGYDYVLAKYDGPNGGAVVWYLGGGTMTLPADSSGLWENTSGKGYGISHWTGFGPSNVPDGGTTIALLGSALVGIGALNRKLRKA